MKKIKIDYDNVLLSSKDFDMKLLTLNIGEIEEDMVSVREEASRKSILIKFSKSGKFYLRKLVACKLLQAAKIFLEKGYVLKIEDAYRNPEIQKKRFLSKVEIIKKECPELTLEEMKCKANTYIAGIPFLAAHTAGAAVDVALLNMNFTPLDFGCSYNTLDVLSITEYPHISSDAKKNRDILMKNMIEVGFTNYPFEYWHFSIGDACDVYMRNKNTTVYAPLALAKTKWTPLAPLTIKNYF